MRVNLMIEGQEGVTWQDWLALAEATEQGGLEGLFRSDHYGTVASPRGRSSLDAWTTIGGLAAVTSGIRLGTMVSPTSFRHPSVLAKSAVTADHISGGRVELGLGAGWNEAEHRAYGFPFHDVGTRYDVFAEQVEIVARQLTEDSFDFSGSHYALEGCAALPKPVQARMPLIIGGNAKPRGAAIAARWADEYNTLPAPLDEVRERKEAIDRAAEAAGREPLVFSVMAGCLLGEDEAEVRDRAALLLEMLGRDEDVDEFMERLRGRWIIGTVAQAAEQLDAYAEVGVTRVMLQHLLHTDIDMVALMGRLT